MSAVCHCRRLQHGIRAEQRDLHQARKFIAPVCLSPELSRSNWPLPRKFVPHTAELALDLQCCILGLIHHILQAIALRQARNGRNSR